MMTGWTKTAAIVTMQVLAAATVAVAAERRDANDAVSSDDARPARRVVVSIPDRRLAVLENGTVIGSFPVAVGAAKSPSPVGTFTIVNRIDRPTYYAPGKVIPPGTRNPLGTRWLGLNVKGYGIHGTDAPRSIGHAQSHGCIRLRNRDVEQLFEMLRPGDSVELHAARTAEIDRIFGAVTTSTQH